MYGGGKGAPMQATKTQRAVEIQLPSFWTCALDHCFPNFFYSRTAFGLEK